MLNVVHVILTKLIEQWNIYECCSMFFKEPSYEKSQTIWELWGQSIRLRIPDVKALRCEVLLSLIEVDLSAL